MKDKDIRCKHCGGLPKIDEGEGFVYCQVCGNETQFWANYRKAWKQWKAMNIESQNIKYVYHAFGDNSYPLCNQHFIHDTGIAEDEKSVTCKRCKKIIKKESEILGKEK